MDQEAQLPTPLSSLVRLSLPSLFLPPPHSFIPFPSLPFDPQLLLLSLLCVVLLFAGAAAYSLASLHEGNEEVPWSEAIWVSWTMLVDPEQQANQVGGRARRQAGIGFGQ